MGYERGAPGKNGKKSEWFKVPEDIGIGVITDQCHNDEILLAKEEICDAATDSEEGSDSHFTGAGVAETDGKTLAAIVQQVHSGQLIPLVEALESQSALDPETDEPGGGDSGC
jgi:hypothetical protein